MPILKTDPTQMRVQKMAYQIIRSRLSGVHVIRADEWADQNMQLAVMLMMNLMKVDWLFNHHLTARKLGTSFSKLVTKTPTLAGELSTGVLCVAEGKKVDQVAASFPAITSLPRATLEQLQLDPVTEWPTFDEWVRIAEQHMSIHKLSDDGKYPTLDMFSNAIVHVMTYAKGRYYHFGSPLAGDGFKFGDNRGYVPARAFFSAKDVILHGESSPRGRRAEFRHRTTAFGSDLSKQGYVDPYALFWCLNYASRQQWRIGFVPNRSKNFAVYGAMNKRVVNDLDTTRFVTGVKLDIVRHPVFAVIRDSVSAIVAATLYHAGLSVYDSSGLSLGEICGMYNVDIDAPIGSFSWNKPMVVCWKPSLIENENVALLTDDRHLASEDEMLEASSLADQMMEAAYGR